MPDFYFDHVEGDAIAASTEVIKLDSVDAAEQLALRAAHEAAVEGLTQEPYGEVIVIVRDAQRAELGRAHVAWGLSRSAGQDDAASDQYFVLGA